MLTETSKTLTNLAFKEMFIPNFRSQKQKQLSHRTKNNLSMDCEILQYVLLHNK